jgi:Uma2 family endonuclease
VTLAMTPTYEPIGRVLTADEFDALPENSLRELVDGVVHMMATPTPWHQDVKLALTIALKSMIPDDLKVTGEIEVRLDDLLRRIPDVLVVKAAGYDRHYPRLRPDQVTLAVEVVSAGSEIMDRVEKPREYALAGIEHYWRVEINPDVVVHTFRLGDRADYVLTGKFTRGDIVQAPGLLWAAVAVTDLAEA